MNGNSRIERLHRLARRGAPVEHPPSTWRRPAAGADAPPPARRPRALGQNLASWATAVSAIAAAIGLFFSATVASSSVEATRQQLEQDRRQQAGKVSFWDQTNGDDDTLVVANRSLDPVTNVELWFYAPDAGVDPAKHEWIFIGFTNIPPCTRLIFAARALDDFLRRYGIRPGGSPVRALQFFDSDGRRWLRDFDGLRAAEYERDDGEDLGVPPARQEPAEHCDK
ncbi:hypothetical protein ACGF5F_32895 [Streptomyces sp. NPDC047821]|uniref:hypothetical protein n=1 Tax=Streptomyces sp. NPDC047821 TaxID=3365488 RepID=UPI0037143C50